MDYKATITLLIGILVTFYVLSAFIPSVDTATSSMVDALDATVTNESLGTADAYGNLSATETEQPISSVTEVYANGTPSTSWANCSYTVDTQASTITVTATATPNSCQNAAITVTYERSNAYGESVQPLPKVSYILALLSVFVGIIYLYWK
jgi:microcystin-dependent protein